MCNQLDKLKIPYFRNPAANIITLKQEGISAHIAHKYGLVPDNHQHPAWYKIVVMHHVTVDKLNMLVQDLKVNRKE
jgi:hypothetical protein